MNETELLNQYYADRNNQWLGVLLQRYTLLLFGVCLKYLKNEEEARDAVQQIFLKTITELQKYRVDYFKSWLYMVAKNHCLMKIRDRQGKRSTEINEELIIPQEDIPIGRHIEKDRKLELMTESLKELNGEQQHCLTLFYLDKKSYQEITGITGFTLMQVKSYIQNGKRNLRNIMERKLKEIPE